ncbi:MAG: DUF7511 domain-containing protein [Natronomonas sp.]
MVAAEIIVSQNCPAECAVSPLDTTDFERLTTWITAKEGSFVSLKTCATEMDGIRGDTTTPSRTYTVRSKTRLVLPSNYNQSVHIPIG